MRSTTICVLAVVMALMACCVFGAGLEKKFSKANGVEEKKAGRPEHFHFHHKKWGKSTCIKVVTKLIEEDKHVTCGPEWKTTVDVGCKAAGAYCDFICEEACKVALDGACDALKKYIKDHPTSDPAATADHVCRHV